MRRGWKVWLAVLLLILLAAAPTAQAAEEEASLEEELQKQADLIDLGPWQAYWEAFSRDTQAGSGSFAGASASVTGSPTCASDTVLIDAVI